MPHDCKLHPAFTVGRTTPTLNGNVTFIEIMLASYVQVLKILASASALKQTISLHGMVVQYVQKPTHQEVSVVLVLLLTVKSIFTVKGVVLSMAPTTSLNKQNWWCDWGKRWCDLHIRQSCTYS